MKAITIVTAINNRNLTPIKTMEYIGVFLSSSFFSKKPETRDKVPNKPPPSKMPSGISIIPWKNKNMVDNVAINVTAYVIKAVFIELFTS